MCKLNEAVCNAHFFVSSRMLVVGKFFPSIFFPTGLIWQELPKPTSDLKRWVERVSAKQARDITGKIL